MSYGSYLNTPASQGYGIESDFNPDPTGLPQGEYTFLSGELGSGPAGQPPGGNPPSIPGPDSDTGTQDDGTGIGYGMSPEEFFQSIWGQELTPEVMEQIAQFLTMFNVEQQAGEAQYKSDYLDYLDKQLDLNGRQLDQAQEQLEFQQGPYWDWYVGEYFPAMQEQERNKLQQSENITEQSANNMRSSFYQAAQQRARMEGTGSRTGGSASVTGGYGVGY